MFSSTEFKLGDTIRIQVVDDRGTPIPDCQVTMLASLHESGIDQQPIRYTDYRGIIEFPVFEPLTVHITTAAPIDGCWLAEMKGAPARIVCPRIEFPASGVGWWHKALGFSTILASQGRGVTVGIIDTGRGLHPALAHVKEIGLYSGGGVLDAVLAAGGHGEHVSGIVAARPSPPRGFWGLAPGAKVISAAIGSDVSQDDIANAVDDLVRDHEVDLINISLAAYKKSNVLNVAIAQAEQSGCLCICAAGNSRAADVPKEHAGKVMWPARYRKAIAVSAVGAAAHVPRDTYAAGCLDSNARAEYVLADFSARGKEIRCCGPGVGVVSSVAHPARINAWVDMSGTSMAAPAVCGTLAARLANWPQYLQSPRNSGRARLARQMLRRMCRLLDMPQLNQGWGIPCLPIGGTG